MARKPYAFRREDNGKIVWVDFQTMMAQRGGFITLPDGVEARRCLHLENRPKRITIQPENAIAPKAISDSLGFCEQALNKFETDRARHGFTDIEFREDPEAPGFFQVHAGSRAAMERYTKHRGLVNRTGSLGGGVMFSQEQLDRAAELAARRSG